MANIYSKIELGTPYHGSARFWVWSFALGIGAGSGATFMYAFYNLISSNLVVASICGTIVSIIATAVAKNFQGDEISEHCHGHTHAHNDQPTKSTTPQWKKNLYKWFFGFFYVSMDIIGNFFIAAACYAWVKNLITHQAIDFYHPTAGLFIAAITYSVIICYFNFKTEATETLEHIDPEAYQYKESNNSPSNMTTFLRGNGAFWHSLEHFSAFVFFLNPKWVRRLYRVCPSLPFILFAASIALLEIPLLIQAYMFDGDAFQRHHTGKNFTNARNIDNTLEQISDPAIKMRWLKNRMQKLKFVINYCAYVASLLHGVTFGFSVFLLAHELLPTPLKAYAYFSLILVIFVGYGTYLSEGWHTKEAAAKQYGECLDALNQLVDATAHRPGTLEPSISTPPSPSVIEEAEDRLSPTQGAKAPEHDRAQVI